MENTKLAAAFNLWMDEYMNDPEAFMSTTASALAHLKEKNEGKELSYGQSCAGTLKAYLERVE